MAKITKGTKVLRPIRKARQHGGQYLFSDRDLSQIREMAELGLRSHHIAALMGISKTCFFNIMSKNEDIRLMYDQGKSNGARKAISHLMTHIENGSEKSLHFYLKFMSGFNSPDEYIEYLASKDESEKKPKFPSSFKFELVEN